MAKGKAGWPSKNFGKKSGGDRDVNPPKVTPKVKVTPPIPTPKKTGN